MITVYHNSRCGKSRDCVAFLENKNQEIKITMIGIPKELKHHFKKPLYIENFDLHAFKKRAEQILRTKVEILSLL